MKLNIQLEVVSGATVTYQITADTSTIANPLIVYEKLKFALIEAMISGSFTTDFIEAAQELNLSTLGANIAITSYSISPMTFDPTLGPSVLPTWSPEVISLTETVTFIPSFLPSLHTTLNPSTLSDTVTASLQSENSSLMSSLVISLVVSLSFVLMVILLL